MPLGSSSSRGRTVGSMVRGRRGHGIIPHPSGPGGEGPEEDGRRMDVRSQPRSERGSVGGPAPRVRGARILEVLALAVVLASAGLLAVGLLPDRGAVVPVEPVPTERLAELMTFEDELLAAVSAYRTPRRIVSAVGLLLGVMVPALLASAIAAGRARRLLRLMGCLPGGPMQVGAAAASVVLITALVRAPLSAWAGVVQDGRHGFRTRTVPGWVMDHLLQVGGRALAVGLLVALFVRIVLRHPHGWPARVTLLAAASGLVALLLHPLVVHPLLLPTGPLPDGEHAEAVLAVLARSDVDVPVLVGEASRRTTRRNAVATGLGPTARVVLHDTLLELGPREVAAITAHEVAHLERHDPLRAALAPVPAVALLAFVLRRWLRSRGRPDVRALTTAAALVLALEAAVTPISAGITRVVEHRTDVRSVAISRDPEAHLTLLRDLVTDGLADPDPPRWSVVLRATHPTPLERMRAVSGAAVPATR